MSFFKNPLVGYLIFFVPLILCSVISCSTNVDPNRKLYIVYMGSLPEGNYSPTENHNTMLQSIMPDSVGHQVLERSFGRTFDGFSAWLTESEREKLQNKEEVLSVFPSPTLKLHTTRSWEFMGFSGNDSDDVAVGSNMIIGVMDTGIWPESQSFIDNGFGPVPTKWKGACKGGQNFTCNRKIIGARFYGGTSSANDEISHGTHTASTAAGNRVKGASYRGVAEGTARGGLPGSRVAVYKVCDPRDCYGDGILAAFDDAIADGVDVITISMGSTNPVELFQDPIAIGSFHAMAKGIATVNSAGNSGDGPGTVYELAPWLVSVGASTTDRVFVDKLILANGRSFTGRVMNPFPSKPNISLAYGRKKSKVCNEAQIKQCSKGCLDKKYVKGKIVICDQFPQVFSELVTNGAAGLVMPDAEYSDRFPIPTVVLEPADLDQVRAYLNSTKRPAATITKSESAKDPLAPLVASFSSRGPNTLFPAAMKPDVVAPGVDILAAFPPYIQPSNADTGSVTYNFESGTSMASPHVAGAIAYIKSQHPTWSPAALKSALMTTAKPLNASMHPDREFAYGSGHINPLTASHPGLIYDISDVDYINILCTVYDKKRCHIISGVPCQCPGRKRAIADLNYPSMAAKINSSSAIDVSFTRVLTNVGSHKTSTYKAQVSVASDKLKITVVPDTLTFKVLNEKQSFKVTITGEYPQNEKILSSSLVWSDGPHTVRSPIILYTNVD